MVTLSDYVDINSIANIFGIVLLVAFIALIVFFVLAIVIGLFRGVFSSVFRLFLMLAFIITAFLTLDSFVNALGTFDLSWISKYIVISNSSGQSITVVVSNFFNTLTDSIAATMYLFGFEADVVTLGQLAVSMTIMILKFIVLIIDMILIVTLGNFFIWLLWHIGFKRLIPKFVRKAVKIRWLSALLSGVRYAVVTVLLISPLSAIVNSINNAWQKYEPQNPEVQAIGTFVDTYNNSLLAQTLFNWTYNSETGLTFDAQLISSLTSTTLGDTEMSIIDLINSIASLGGSAMSLVGDSDVFSITNFLSTESLTQLFSSLNNFAILPYLLPLGFTIALNSDLLGEIDVSRLELSNIDWQKELETLETIVIDVVNTGIVSAFIDENGEPVSSVNASDVLDAMFADDAYGYTLRVLETIDNSELLSQIVPLVMSYVAGISPDVGKFLPNSYQECKAIKWGFELSILYDNLFRLNKVSPELIEHLIQTAAPSEAPQSVMFANGEDSQTGPNSGIDEQLLDLIIDNIDTFKTLFVGQFDRNGNLINCNSDGYTLASNSSGYCLFDLNILRGAFRPLVETIVSSINVNMGDEYSEIFEDAFGQLFDGPVVKNFKVEFGAIFDCLKDISQNESFKNAMMNGQFDSLMEINKTEADELGLLIEGLERSSIITSVLKPFLAQALESPELSASLETIGLDVNDFNIIDCDDICFELAQIIRALPSINNVSTLMETDDVMSKIGEYTEDIAFVLDTVFVSDILNPNFDKNSDNNFYRVLEIVFDLTESNGISGLEFKRDEVNAELGYQKWNNTLTPEGDYPRDRYGKPIYDGEIGDLINTLNSLCFVNVTIGSPFMGKTLFECFADSTVDMADLVGRLEKEFHISNVFACVEESALIKPTFGDFIDSALLSLGEIGLIDIDAGRTFNNVTDWSVEGLKFGQMCNIMGEIEIDLANLDLLSFDDFDGLNKLLHSIADLSLFIDPQDRINGTTFNDFLFDKIKDALVTDSLDLLSDETSTDTEKTFLKAQKDWQIKETDGTDIVALKEDWCSSSWMEQFIDDDNHHDIDSNFFEGDLIAQACRVIKSLDEMKKATEEATGETYQNYIEALTSAKTPSDKLQSTLLYINNFQPLRMVIYHVFDLIFSTVDTGGFINFGNANTVYLAHDITNAEMRAFEINKLIYIYDFYLNSIPEGSSFDYLDYLDEPKHFVEIHDLITEFVDSAVFHTEGPQDGEGLTCFQSIINSVLKMEGLKEMLYSDDPLSKDQSTEYSSKYYDADSKIDYMIRVEHFDYHLPAETQKDKISDLFEVISSFLGGPVCVKDADILDDFSLPGKRYEGLLSGGDSLDFGSLDLTSVSTSALRETFICLNDSDLLYEIVPNALNSLFSDENNDLLNDLAGNSDPFYAYYLVDENNPNFNARYSIQEIDNLCLLIDHFEEMNNYLGDGDITKLLQLPDAEFDIFISELENMFGNLYNSYVFHQYNNVKQIDDFSSFEKFVEKIFIDTSLYTLIYNEEVDAVRYNPSYTLSNDEAARSKLEDAIRRMSQQDYNFNFVTGDLNTVGLSDVWFDDDDVTNDEIKAFGNFMRAVKSIHVSDLGSFEIDLDNTEMFNPDNIGSVFHTLNRIDVAEGAVGHLMKQLMNESGMSTYSSYRGVDYAAYFMTQREFDSYGGLEIVVQFLRNVAVYDEDGVFVSYNVLNKNADDPFVQYVENGKSTSYILEFITYSLMYTHDEIVLDNGDIVKDDAVLFYNLFTPNSTNIKNISDYIYGNTMDEKIGTLNHIIHHFDYHPEYDGNAIDVLLLCGFNNKTFDASSFDSIKLLRESLYKGLVALTRQDGNINNPDRGRAFIASEIFAGIFEEFIYSEIDYNNNVLSSTDPFYLDHDYFQVRKCIEDRQITSYYDINEDSYDLLNVDEARGINSILAMYAGDQFDDYLTLEVDDINNYFAEMEYQYVKQNTNSRFATLIYVSRIRNIFDQGFAIAKFMGFTQQHKINSALDLLDFTVPFTSLGSDVAGAISTIASVGI